MKKLIIATIALVGLSISAQAQLKLKSGVEGGSYNQMAQELKEISSQPIDISTSKGSRDNFFALRNGDADIGFLQYDVLFYQIEIEQDNSKKVDGIRVLLPLGWEEIHLITRKSSNIKSLADLHGKKVGVGSKYQGTIITVSYIKLETEYKWKDVRIPFEKAFEALESGKIDAFFFVGSAPVAKLNNISDALKNDLTLVPITDPALEDYYAKVTIKAGTYEWLTEDVETYAVRYALATNVLYEDEAKYEKIEILLRDIKLNIDELQLKGHPMWKHVDFKFNRIMWDVHDAAKKVYNLQNIDHQF